MTTTEQYRTTSLHLYDQAMDELDAGDLLQASEKLWGAAAQALKCVAERRGWKHNSHAQFYNIVAMLIKETQNSTIRDYFDTATHLHINFYENRLDENEIRSRAEKIFSFIDLLNSLSCDRQN